MSNRVCGECRFHKYLALKNLDFMGITIEEWYCDNWYSKRSGQITQYNDTCEEWAEDSTIECSICHEHQPMGIDENFCPNCGARMKGADDE